MGNPQSKNNDSDFFLAREFEEPTLSSERELGSGNSHPNENPNAPATATQEKDSTGSGEQRTSTEPKKSFQKAMELKDVKKKPSSESSTQKGKKFSHASTNLFNDEDDLLFQFPSSGSPATSRSSMSVLSNKHSGGNVVDSKLDFGSEDHLSATKPTDDELPQPTKPHLVQHQKTSSKGSNDSSNSANNNNDSTNNTNTIPNHKNSANLNNINNNINNNNNNNNIASNVNFDEKRVSSPDDHQTTPKNQTTPKISSPEEPLKDSASEFSKLFENSDEEEEDLENDLVEEDPDAEILSEWMSKQAVMRGGKNDPRVKNTTAWRNRLFALKRGCLFYYVVEDVGKYQIQDKIIVTRENTVPELLVRKSGSEPVVGYKFNISFSDATAPSFFEVQWKQNFASTTTLPTRTFLAATGTEKDLKRWLDFFSDLNTKNFDQLKEANQLEYKGNLMIFNSESKLLAHRYWEQRRVVCRVEANSQLHNPMAKKIEFLIQKKDEKGYFPLAGCILESEDAFSFDILSETSTMNLRCKEMEQRTRWMKAIEKEIKRLQKTENDPIARNRDYLDLVGKLGIVLKAERKRIKEWRELHNKESEQNSKPTTIPRELSVKRKKFFILSIDGGGLRGIITTLILTRLMGHFPDLIDRVDLLTGTSNGGMVAMSLAFDWDPKFCHNLLELTANLIFKRSMLQNKMSRAMFPATHIKILCDTIWGTSRLKDAKKRVVIPAFLMDNECEEKESRSCETRIFHNLDDDPKNGCSDLVSDVVMRTCAAPTFFPSFQKYVDGGIFAHDPASTAMTYSIGPKLNIPPSDIVLLSLGTGKVNHFYPSSEPNPSSSGPSPNSELAHDWGYVQWLPKLAHCFWDGMLMKSQMLCTELLGERYLRLDPYLDKEISMDDPLMIPLLTQVARDTDLTKIVHWINRHVYEDE